MGLIDELHAFQNQKYTIELKTFNDILNRCIEQIKFENQHGKTKTVFKVPSFMLGYPIYNRGKSIEYVYKCLIDKGFICIIKCEDLHITWEVKESNFSSNTREVKLNTGDGYDSDDLRIMEKLFKK